MHNKVRKESWLKSKKTSIECIRDRDDKMLFEQDDIRKWRVEYFYDLYNDDRDENFT